MHVQCLAYHLLRGKCSVNVSIVSQALFPGERPSGCRHGVLGDATLGEAGSRRFKCDLGVQGLVGRDGLGSFARVLQLLVAVRGWSQEESGDLGFLVALSGDGPCPGRGTGREGGSCVAAGWQVALQWCDGDCGHLRSFSHRLSGGEGLTLVRQGRPWALPAFTSPRCSAHI